MDCAKVPQGVRKVKKKPVKDELDRMKQTEKKKRRLEKALANSAAIRSELEKKKQMKLEQQRLDQEGASIAEAVALNVLLDEDINESSKFMLNQDDGLYNICDSLGLCLPHRNFKEHDVYGNWNAWRNNRSSILSGPLSQNIYMPYSNEISGDLIVAQAVASLQIADDARFDPCIYDRVIRG